ncbi:MAG: alpha-ribazole phosphatase [Actinobacteria bacterium]|nr:alpha-ribazole phosphatase [Actinomycetota bacterium]MBU1942349.1 alpha-ribazole phosphatase [Actinomycetota bacterium]MBU2686343.1 alpha-ribazole phosphatase [Actinomycetota bacterium]
MSKVILVRHGRTAWHAEGRYCGTADVPLDEIGRQQAERVSGALARRNIVAVYSSPLSRCSELAEGVAAAKGLEVIVDPRLREIDLGRWDGQTYKEIVERDGEMLGRWTRDPTSVTIPGGESLGDVQDRAMDWFHEATSAYPDSTIVASSHGGPIRAVLAAVIGMPLANIFRLTVDLAGICVVNYQGEFSNVKVLNDTSHLDGIEDKSVF